MRKSLFILLFCILSQLCLAQTPLLRELKLTDEGRALEITSAIIDQQGVMWLTTKTGLYINNGENATKLMSIDVPDAVVSSIYKDSHGIVWVGNSKGKLFRFENYIDTRFNPAEGFPASPISQMAEDALGNLWIGTLGEGLYIYSKGKFFNLDQDDGLADNYVYCVQPSGRESIVCGTDLGFNYCTFSNPNKKVQKHVNAKNGLSDEIVRDLKYVRQNLLAVGTQEKGVQFFDESANQFVQIGTPTSGMVNTLCNINGELWAGFENEGIVDFEFQPDIRVRNLGVTGLYGIKRIQKIINSPYYSQIIVAENKLFVTPGEWYETWASPADVSDKQPRAIAAHSDIVFVAYESGIYFRHFADDWKKLGLSLSGFSYKAISCMILDKNDHLWIGSLNDGLVCVDFDGNILKRISIREGLINNNIYCLALYGDVILYGSMNGIGGVNINTFQLTQNAQPACSDLNVTAGQYVYDITINKKKEIFFGTDGQGIGFLKSNKLGFISPGEQKEKNIILCLDAGNENSLWFSSSYYGLFQARNEKIIEFPALIGVNSSPVNAMCVDNYSNILTIHDDFFSIFDPGTKQQFVVQNDFGFSGVDVSNNMIVSNESHVYIATKNGIVVFQPRRFRFMSNMPLIIKRKLLFLQPIERKENKKAVFSFDQHHLSFECNFPWFFNPEKIKYQYVLDGFSDDTIFTSNSLITFPNLPPGKYKFKVRGKLQNALLNNGWTEHSFEIKEPWFKALWFIIAVILGLILAVYLGVKFRIKHFFRIAESKRFKLSQELRAMQSQVNPHFLFNSLSSLMGLIDVDPEKAKEYTEKLSDFYRDIVKYKDTDLIPLTYELEIVDTYIYLQNIRFDDSITVVKKLSSLSLEKAKIAPLTLQILYENAIKHNKVGQGNQLQITIETSKVGILVSNNLNPKKYPESSTKAGLGFIKDRCRILTGREAEVTVTTEQFAVYIPLVY